MKTFLIVLFTIGLSFALGFAKAQTQGGRISGQVSDNTKKSIEGATVALINSKDSTITATIPANADGSFVFDKIKPGSYKITITSIGYELYKSNIINVSGEQVLKLPAVIMKQAAKVLDDVAVVSQKPYVEQKIDRTVVNVGASISNTGANALEALEKVPGVIIDENGNITFKGKSGVMIMIDDKPTYLSGENLANYLKSLPASLLDQIELMSTPPAKYDAAGTAGVINIKTKKSKTKGFNGSIAASVGKAAYWRTNESISMNYRVDKVNLFANIGYNLQNNYRRLDLGRSYKGANGSITSTYTEVAYFHPVTYNPNLKVGMDYSISPKTTMGFVLTGSQSTGHNANPVNSTITNGAGMIDSVLVANNNTRSKFYNGGINLNYSHKFDSSGKVISFDLDYVKYDNHKDQSFFSNTYNAAGGITDSQHITAGWPVDIDIYSAKADYVQQLKNKGKFEAGLKSSYVNTDNAANYFIITNNIPTVDNNNTNRFLYKENINAAYVNYNGEFKRFSLQTGLRVENTNINGRQLGNAQSPDSSFSQHYVNLFPTAYVSYKLDTAGVHLLNISYGRRISRPYYQDLNPFITILDRYNQWVGNPFLKPQFSSNYQLTYSYKSKFSISLVYSYISNFQSESDEQVGDIFMARSVNLGHSIHKGINANVNLSPFKWWSFNVYGEMSNNSYVGQLSNTFLNANRTYFYGNANNQFSLPHGWSAELSGFYISSTAYGQFLSIPKGQVNVGLQKKVLNNKGAVKLNVRDLFRTNFSGGQITNLPNMTATFHNDNANRAVTLGFTYSFGSSDFARKKRDTGSADEQNRAGN
ncbi:outer membrane beta-barrel protein [Chitinophagaceae bacterium LWZ2-11]